jgi:hypothetical protein
MVYTDAELGCRILLGVGSLETTVLKNVGMQEDEVGTRSIEREKI